VEGNGKNLTIGVWGHRGAPHLQNERRRGGINLCGGRKGEGKESKGEFPTFQ